MPTERQSTVPLLRGSKALAFTGATFLASHPPPPLRRLRFECSAYVNFIWVALREALWRLLRWPSPHLAVVVLHPELVDFHPKGQFIGGRPQAASGTISEFLTAPSPHWVLFPSPIFFSIGLSGSPKTFTTSPFSWRHLWITPSSDLQFFQKEIPVDLKGALLRETFSGKFLSVCCFPCEIYVCESL